MELKNEAPEIIILVGLPGVGKSTYIKNRFPNHVIISSDDIIEKYAEEHNMTYDDAFHFAIGAASGQIRQQFYESIKSNKNIVWDQTNLSKNKRKGVLNNVPDHYRKVAIVFNIPDKVRYERMGQRPGKTIPPHVVKNMEKSYQAPSKDEGFDEIIEVRE